MNIRPAALSDLDAILELANGQAARYPLRPDPVKMRQLAVEAISAARHFVWVAEDQGSVCAILAGMTSSNLWAQRQNCNIVLWVSECPGAGAALLRRFRDWIKPRRGIKVAGMSPDLEIDPRALALAERVGFRRHGGAYLLYN